MMATGSCLCGAVRYRVTGALRPVVACHCSQCRKTSGHYVAATAALKNELTIEGSVNWYQSSADARRGFCGTCGSNLFWDAHPERMSIFAGTLDGQPDLTIWGHIFCADKGSYYDLPEGPHMYAGAAP